MTLEHPLLLSALLRDNNSSDIIILIGSKSDDLIMNGLLPAEWRIGWSDGKCQSGMTSINDSCVGYSGWFICREWWRGSNV